MAVNVYGLRDEDVESFKESILVDMLIGRRQTKILWQAESIADLMRQINEDPNIISGSCKLSEHTNNNTIDLPECGLMHLNNITGDLYCGKPTNKYGDGSFGGCVLQGYDQDFEGCDFICPAQEFFRRRN
jgi:hypothetical protein